MRGLTPPGPQDFQNYAVNNPNREEIIYAPLYDYTTYAQAGQTSLTFFQTPQGQSGKTYYDTNMELAGALPNPQKFLLQGIEIDFFPGGEAGRGAVSDYPTNWKDVYDVFKSGYLELNIGNKIYVRDAPLGVFPSTHRIGGMAALTGTDGATANTIDLADYAAFAGRPYEVIPMSIPSQQNFSVKMIWPTAVGISLAARIGVRLNGYLYRASQ